MYLLKISVSVWEEENSWGTLLSVSCTEVAKSLMKKKDC